MDPPATLHAQLYLLDYDRHRHRFAGHDLIGFALSASDCHRGLEDEAPQSRSRREETPKERYQREATGIRRASEARRAGYGGGI